MEKSLVQSVFDTMKGWGEPITITEILSYLDMEENPKTRQAVAVVISSLKLRHKIDILTENVGNTRKKQYQIMCSKEPNPAFGPPVKPFRPESKIKAFMGHMKEKVVVEDKKLEPDASNGTGGSQVIERRHETMRQKEIAEEHKAKAPTKDLSRYEIPCHHYVLSKMGTISSVQVAEYYNLTEEEGACLLNRVSKRFNDVRLTVFAQAN